MLLMRLCNIEQLIYFDCRPVIAENQKRFKTCRIIHHQMNHLFFITNLSYVESVERLQLNTTIDLSIMFIPLSAQSINLFAI